MELIDPSKVRIYLNNKAAANVVQMDISVSHETLPYIKGTLIQRVPADGLFNTGVREVRTECVLENWRDQVIRFRTVKDGAVNQDEECEGPTEEECPDTTEEEIEDEGVI